MSEQQWRTERRKVLIMVELPNGERRAEWIERDVQVVDLSGTYKSGETFTLPPLTLPLTDDAGSEPTGGESGVGRE